MLCEEGMTTAKARNALLVPYYIRWAIPTKTQSNIGKIDKHCTNCGMTNHNVETCF
jgi:hypothetical protein